MKKFKVEAYKSLYMDFEVEAKSKEEAEEIVEKGEACLMETRLQEFDILEVEEVKNETN